MLGDAISKLTVKFSADTRNFDTALKKTSRGLKGFGDTIMKHHRAIGIGMAALGGSIVAMGVKSVGAYAKMGDEIHKMALRTGFSTVALSELRYAAQLSGTELGSVEKAVKRMSGTILDAKDGLETYIRAFRHIGIEVKELEGLKPEEQFMRIMEALADVTDASDRAALAADIFGRAGTELLPMLEDGAEGLRNMNKAAHEFSFIFEQEAAEAAAKFNNSITDLKESLNSLQVTIGEILAPLLENLANKMTTLTTSFIAFSEKHPEFSAAFISIGGAIGLLMLALAPLVIMLPYVMKGLTMIGHVIKAVLLVAIKLLLTPIGLLVLGLGMIAFGVWKIIDAKKKYAEVLADHKRRLEEHTKLQEEYNKALRGEINTYGDLMEAQLEDIKMRVAMGEATDLEIGWLYEHGKAAEEYIAYLKRAKDATTEWGDETVVSYGKAGEAVDGYYKKVKDLRDLQTLLPGGGGAAMDIVEFAKYAGITVEEAVAMGAEARQKKIKFWTKARPTAFLYGRMAKAAGGYEAAAQAAGVLGGGFSLQAGGIVTKPILASVAERGPEAIIPLSNMMFPRRREAPVQVIFRNPIFLDESNISKVGDILIKYFRQEMRLLYGQARW